MNELTPPKVGQRWAGQGGFYAGIIRDGDTQWHLILADAPAQTFKWGEYGSEIPGEFSRCNGSHNTGLIIATAPENEAANFVKSIELDGHKDFYWPAAFENNLICINCRDQIAEVWHWSSTQYSAHYAWLQYFEDGSQSIYHKSIELAVRAVRRILVI